MNSLVLLLGRVWGCQTLEHLALEGLVVGWPVPGEMVQCPALLLIMANKALTESFSQASTEPSSKEVGKAHKDPWGLGDRRDSLGYLDYKDSKDSKDLPDSKDHRDPRGLAGHEEGWARPGQQGQQVQQVQQGRRAKALIFHQTSYLKQTISSPEASIGCTGLSTLIACHVGSADRYKCSVCSPSCYGSCWFLSSFTSLRLDGTASRSTNAFITMEILLWAGGKTSCSLYRGS